MGRRRRASQLWIRWRPQEKNYVDQVDQVLHLCDALPLLTAQESPLCNPPFDHVHMAGFSVNICAMICARSCLK
jgi:hypothetical protein